MIIGLVGKKRSGKDTVADWLVKYAGFIKYSLADPMKKACKEIFLFSDEQLWGDKKEEIDEALGVTPRKILQVFGTELFQYDIYKHIPELANKIPPRKLWINRFVRWYKRNEHSKWTYNFVTKMERYCFDVVISDVRFPHEAEEIKKLNGMIIRIERDLPNVDKHASETEMEDIKEDFKILNDGTIDDLYKKIKKFLGDIYWDTYIDS